MTVPDLPYIRRTLSSNAFITTQRHSDYTCLTASNKSTSQLQYAPQDRLLRPRPNGSGFEADPSAADQQLAEKYPLSRRGYSPWDFQRALPYDASQPTKALLIGNSAIFEYWRALQNVLASAPMRVVELIAKLFEHGVAKHVVASYADVKRIGGDLELKGFRFHSLMAPQILTNKADKVLASYRSQVKQVAGQPEYAKGRVLALPDGTLCNVSDSGLGGHGTSVRDAQGKTSTLGNRWTDTNARASAAQYACVSALETLTASIIHARGDPAVSSAMQRLYEANLEPEHVFRQEAYQAQDAYRELTEMLLFHDLIRKISHKDGELYAQYFEKIHNADDRATFVRKQKKLEPDNRHFRVYEESARNRSPFYPKTQAEYDAQFVDYTQTQAGAMLDKVLAA